MPALHALLCPAAGLGAEAGPAMTFTVPEMADFLFNSSDAASCAAALRLLRDDRLYFKQVRAGGTVMVRAVQSYIPGAHSHQQAWHGHETVA